MVEKTRRRTVAATPVILDPDRPVDSGAGVLSRPSEGFRHRLAKQTDEAWESIEKTLRETIESATKQEHVACPSCAQRFPILRRDYSAALRAVELMLDRVIPKPSASSGDVEIGSFENVTKDQMEEMSTAELEAYVRWHYARNPDALIRETEDVRAFREHFALHGREGVIEQSLRSQMKHSESRLREAYDALKTIFEPSPSAAS